MNTERAIYRKLSRRSFLAASSAGGLSLIALNGCNVFPAESGSPYAPWDFPEHGAAPELIAVGAAILAANPHNSQPWLFDIRADGIDVYADLAKSLGAMDPLHREMYIGLGCAIENLAIAADAQGLAPRVALMPSGDDDTHVAAITFASGPATQTELFDAIPRRHTNRGEYLDTPAPPELEPALQALLSDDAVQLTFFADGPMRSEFRRQTIRATRRIVGDREMNDASHHWYRHTHDDIVEHRDGLTLDTTGVNDFTRFMGKVFPAPSAESAGNYWVSSTEGRHTTGFGFGILTTPNRDSREEQLRCGREYQRIALWAQLQGLCMQPLNQMAERQDREEELGLDPEFTTVLGELLGTDELGAQMLFRIGVSWDQTTASPRRPIEWVTR